MDNKKVGIYIHIPFCSKKCDYCDFVSYSMNEDAQQKYLDHLKIEIEIMRKKMLDRVVDSVYIGGGTPSFVFDGFMISLMHAVYSNFHIEKGAEITIEVNPSSLTEQKLIEYRLSGINRISLGVQCMDEEILKNVGRIQSVENVKSALDLLKKVYFQNVCVDLMIGLPGQSIKTLKSTIDFIFDYPIKHVSLYSLQIEPNTPLHDKVEAYKQQEKMDMEINLRHTNIDSLQKKQSALIIDTVRSGAVKPLDEDECVDLYNYAYQRLEDMGYRRYEVSNFAMLNFQSRHNKKYWDRDEYIGLGCSAHSYFEGFRYSNTPRLDTYIDKLAVRVLPIDSREFIDSATRRTEYIMLAMRTQKGLDISMFKQDMNEDILLTRKPVIERLRTLGMIKIENGYLRIASDQFYVANQIILELI